MRILREMKSGARFRAKLMRSRLGHAVLAPNLRFRVQRWRVETPLWGARAPLRIGILSDLHWGRAPVPERGMATLLRRFQAVHADIGLFLGDLADGPGLKVRAVNMRLGAERLADLRAPLGRYAVLGNHDWHDDPVAQARRAGPVATAAHLRRAGFEVMQNTAVRPGRGDIWLAGLDSQQAFKRRPGEVERQGADDLAQTLAAAPGEDPIILAAHEPDIFPEIADPRVVLVLSGHMHGGQIRPFGRALYAPSRFGTRYDHGHFEEGGRHLVVSGGLGCSKIPLRIGIMPEITVVEIGPPV